jgi:hypothetical protein
MQKYYLLRINTDFDFQIIIYDTAVIAEILTFNFFGMKGNEYLD